MILQDINTLSGAVIAATHKNRLKSLGKDIKGKKGRDYELLKSFFESDEFRGILESSARRESQAAMGLAMALEAQQRRVTELTKESLQEKAGDSDEEGESLFSITDPEASDEGNTETQPARLTQDPDQVNNMISGWLKEVPASSDGNEEAVEPNAAVPTPPPATESYGILSSGKDVGAAVRQIRSKIPAKQQPFSLLWHGIINVSHGGDQELEKVFTPEEVAEMHRDFEKEVALEHLDAAEVNDLASLMDAVQEKVASWDGGDVENLIDDLELIRGTTQYNKIRRIVTEFCRNVTELEQSSASEVDADAATSAFLVKRILSLKDPKWRCEAGELQSLGSIYARNIARSPSDSHSPGQKCDIRLTLDSTSASMEALIHLRAGGLPAPVLGGAKFRSDKTDLAECLLEVIYAEARKMLGVQEQSIRKLFVLGTMAHGFDFYVYGLKWRAPGIYCFCELKKFMMPSQADNIAELEIGISTLLRVKKTLHKIEMVFEEP